LSILDLGAGARAYADEAGRFRVICNGEIYNDPELRRHLIGRGHRFETRCDTEVIPHLYEEHGLSFVHHLDGMFAFAVFDARDNRLVLGRDRAGEKPLYYLEQDGEAMLASEIKALLAHPRVIPQPDLRALPRYLLCGYFPAPHPPLAGLAVDLSGGPVPTFTLGFDDPDFNEADYARRAAAHFGTEHHETIVGEPQMLEALLSMARVLDEPLADASIVPTHLLSCFARQHVKVTLGGEGGDELFAGYPTYIGDRLARSYMRLPAAARGLVRRAVEAIPPAFNNVGTEYLLKKFVAGAELPQAVRHQFWFGAFPPDRQEELLSPGALAAMEA